MKPAIFIELFTMSVMLSISIAKGRPQNQAPRRQYETLDYKYDFQTGKPKENANFPKDLSYETLDYKYNLQQPKSPKLPQPQPHQLPQQAPTQPAADFWKHLGDQYRIGSPSFLSPSPPPPSGLMWRSALSGILDETENEPSLYRSLGTEADENIDSAQVSGTESFMPDGFPGSESLSYQSYEPVRGSRKLDPMDPALDFLNPETLGAGMQSLGTSAGHIIQLIRAIMGAVEKGKRTP